MCVCVRVWMCVRGDLFVQFGIVLSFKNNIILQVQTMKTLYAFQFSQRLFRLPRRHFTDEYSTLDAVTLCELATQPHTHTATHTQSHTHTHTQLNLHYLSSTSFQGGGGRTRRFRKRIRSTLK